MKKLGLSNVVEVDKKGETINGFEIKSYVNKDISHDDSLYTIKTANSLVVHSNDMWQPLAEDFKRLITKDVNSVGKDKLTIFPRQTLHQDIQQLILK